MTSNYVRTRKAIALLLSIAMVTVLFSVLPITGRAMDYLYFEDVSVDGSMKTTITDPDGNPLEMPISRDQEFRLYFEYEILNGQIQSDDILIYSLPEGIEMAGALSGYIQGPTGQYVGTYEYSGGEIYFDLDDSFVAQNDNIKGHFSCSLKFDDSYSSKHEEGSFTFPGSGEVFDVTFQKKIDAEKKYEFDPETGKLTFYIEFTPDADYNNVTLSDVLGSNLKFPDDIVFEMKSGWANWGDPTLNPNDVIELEITSKSGDTTQVLIGSVKAGMPYSIRYSVDIKDPFLNSGDNSNIAKWKIDGEEAGDSGSNGPQWVTPGFQKSGYYDESTGTVKWTIRVNERPISELT